MTTSNLAEDTDPTESLRALYLEGAFNDVAELEALMQKVEERPTEWSALQRRMREIAHNVKGQGSSFGFPLMTRLGQSLWKLLVAVEAAGSSERRLLAAHIGALRAVLDQNIEGSGGALGDALAGRLERLVEQLG